MWVTYMQHSKSQVPSANEQLLWLTMTNTEVAKATLELLNGCNLKKEACDH